MQHLVENSSLWQIFKAGRKFVRNYVSGNKVGIGKKVAEALNSNSFLNTMRDMDKQLNSYERERDKTKGNLMNTEFNYNISDSMVKPLNYSTKSGRTSIINEYGEELNSQMDDVKTRIASNPDAVTIKDISFGPGNRIKEGKGFNKEISRIMNTWDFASEGTVPRIDKDGNVIVELNFKTKGTEKQDLFKKF